MKSGLPNLTEKDGMWRERESYMTIMTFFARELVKTV